MKYMGSKLSLLDNGLDEVLLREVKAADRFVDLFCGTGRVSWFVAETAAVSVLATDLQCYAAVLARAIVGRTSPISMERIVDAWLRPARDSLAGVEAYEPAVACSANVDASAIDAARQLCTTMPGGPIWRSYGGHYFSPLQALTFDHLIEHIPPDGGCLSNLCRASLVLAASKCVAAPGHTAQPFQPSSRALPYIRLSWCRDTISLTQAVLEQIAPRHARVLGESSIGNANDVAKSLGNGDVVFVDPPYSNVQYSRFYHVLETIARGSCSPVSGVGRYPPQSERPRSEYSLRSGARKATADLLRDLGQRGCRVLLTFPHGDASNGLNGEQLIETASDWFVVDVRVVYSRFSTLGGNGYNRRARHSTEELLLTMRPR